MIIGEVIGNLWSTIQVGAFSGTRLLIVQPLDPLTRARHGNTIVAVDVVSAGIGDTVLVVYEGSSSRLSLGSERTPCEAIVAGIVDCIDLPGVREECPS
jgi:ethanolamine utilization protein EutN